MLKLNHLVDDKMHARSTGFTAWLLSSRWVVRHSSVVSVRGDGSVGAGSIRRSIHPAGKLTVKSDDVNGRTKMYKNIVAATIRWSRACQNPSTYC